MINFILNNFVYAQESLRHLLVDISEKAVSSPQEAVSAVDHQRVASITQVVGDQCVEALCLHDAWNTIQELYYILGEHHVRPFSAKMPSRFGAPSLV